MSRESFIVRVLRSGSSATAGVGFVVGERQIVTCAHVVNSALGLDKHSLETPSHTMRVQVEFPLLGDGDEAPSRLCRVDVWQPPPGPGSTGRDIAGLTVLGENLPARKDRSKPGGQVKAGAARLAPDLTSIPGGEQVQVFGYPADDPHGYKAGGWAPLLYRGEVGGGHVQFDGIKDSPFHAQPGYSGSPIVHQDESGDIVLGMFSAIPHKPYGQDSYAVPVSWLIDAWPAVLGHLSGDPAAEEIAELAGLLAQRPDAARLLADAASAALADLDPGMTIYESVRKLAGLLTGTGEQSPLAMLERGLSRDADNQDGPSCLVARIDRDSNVRSLADGSKLYRLSLQVLRDGRVGEPIRHCGDCAAFPEIKERLIREVPDLIQTVDRSSLVVEFLVPRELLNEDFDQWLVPEASTATLDSDKYVLGVDYQVVVRDLDRMTATGLHSLWKTRSQRIATDGGVARGDAICWVEPSARLTYDKLKARLLTADNQICMALLDAPTQDSRAAELLRAGLNAGMPVAIWLRHTGADERVKDCLAAVLDSVGLQALPKHVLDLRRKANAYYTDDHHGRHMTLLWDVAGRLRERPAFIQPSLA